MNKTTHPIEPEELMAYLDGELSANRDAEVVEHLSVCQECQGIVASLRGVSGSLDTWKLGQPDSEIPTLI
ncbi:MAG TPA: zf-HC2 domain-containing protein, partial [Terriglobales bacterium]